MLRRHVSGTGGVRAGWGQEEARAEDISEGDHCSEGGEQRATAARVTALCVISMLLRACAACLYLHVLCVCVYALCALCLCAVPVTVTSVLNVSLATTAAYAYSAERRVGLCDEACSQLFGSQLWSSSKRAHPEAS